MTSVVDQLKEICFNETTGSFNSSRMSEAFFLKNFPHLIDVVKESTNFYVDSEISFNKRLGLIFGGYFSRLQCKTCGSEIDPNNRSESKGKFFREYCCQECSGAANKGTKIVRTKEQQDAINAKRANTMIEKYGVAFNNLRSAVSSDVVLTDYSLVLDKNGNPSKPKKSKLINDATVADLKLRTGLDTDDVNTLLYFAMGKEPSARYCGCGSVIDIHNFQIGYRENQRSCSYKCKDSSEEYRERLATAKRGVSRFDSPVFVENRMRPWLEERRELLLDYDIRLNSTLEEYIADKEHLSFTCLHCSTEYIHNFGNNARIPVCPRCKTRSVPQMELVRFVESLGFSVLVNDRSAISPYELDIFIPSLNIGIEYDGFYFHDDKKDVDKLHTIRNSDLRVIRVFEDEYRNKKSIVLSRISAILGKSQTTVYARNCDIREISPLESREFLEENHIQGNVDASIKYGLFCGLDLVSVMTFSKPRYDKTQEYELIRFCSKLGYSVVGGASKLFSTFLKTYAPTSVISYCDLRYGDGVVYEKLGFINSGYTDQNYFYYKNRKRLSRVACQKHKLKDFLPEFDENLTETENMKYNGYLKIYDSGNLIFKWRSLCKRT